MDIKELTERRETLKLVIAEYNRRIQELRDERSGALAEFDDLMDNLQAEIDEFRDRISR